ncbi:TonB-dependent receptor [Sphingomonas histidinilytica]|uniref:TonB-dependent receptor n=1 Tax=Rhizorhabdus histidinilytica TaxID=439228 RepID=UPI001ADD4EB1|nr:TonB-dependent receptor [Rhizorhabdus histidinilytica]MBO9380762.1 TonB-dependent receptor [Rhizorhabdus histidinilytica]
MSGRRIVSTSQAAIWALASGILCTPIATRAQETPASAEPEGGVGEIIVTAQRREQRLQDVPVAVSVISGASLASTNITGLQDLSVRLPNVRIATSPGSSLLNIRGVGSGINSGFEQSVGTFIDGVYRGRSRATAAALFDVERIEVLKGPQTTFFGNNVIAGALNITTRKPKFESGGTGSLVYSPSDGEYGAELGVDVAVSDKLALRFAGKAFGMNGYVRNESIGKDEPHNRDAVGRVSLAWEPTDTWRTDLRVDLGRMRDRTTVEGIHCPADPAYGAPRGTCARYLASGQPVDDSFDYHSNNFGSRFSYDYQEVALTNSVDLGALTLSSISSYFHHKNQTLSDAAPFPVPGFGGGASATVVNYREDFSQYSQELRLTSPQSGLVQYMFGAYYAHERLDANQYIGAYQGPFGQFAGAPYTAATPVAQHVTALQRTNNWSVFGSLTVRPVDQLSIDLGLRYSHVRKTINRSFQYGIGDSIPEDGAFTPFPQAAQNALQAVLGGNFGNFGNPRKIDDKLMPSAKISYKIAPGAMIYASYSSGFKAGGYGISPVTDIFDPETVNAYEAGLKASMLNNRLFTSLIFFRSDYKNLQEATQTIVAGNIVTRVSNAARSRSQGIEWAVDAKLSNSLALHADVAYLDAKYRNYTNGSCTVLGSLTPGCIQDMSGKARGFSPKLSGSVSLNYNLALRDDLDLRIDPVVYFSSRYFQSATADPLLEQSGYAKVDLRVGIGPEDRKWEFAVIGKNLTDRKTASFRNQFAGAPGSVWLTPERPRSIAFQASAKF